MTLLGQVMEARQDEGKPALQQICEMLLLRLAKPAIGIGEYFDYGIYRRDVSSPRRAEFIGWRGSLRLDDLLNDRSARVLANDKLLNYLVLHAAGLPMPEPIATYTTTGRRIARETTLGSLNDVHKFLDGASYPFYVKPVSAGYGRGVLGVREKRGSTLLLLDDSELTIGDFLKPFSFAPFGGMLFQRPLLAHPRITKLTGSTAISCARLICIVTPAGPIVHTAFWKVTAGRNMLDNFTHGKFGNCLASIDIRNGVITRAISRLGPGGAVVSHPTTGRSIVGFSLPHWEQAVALVCTATRHFPGLRLQNWDVALCPEGPVLLELNTESELAIPQAVSGLGLMDARLRSILADIEAQRRLHSQQVARGPNAGLPSLQHP